MKFKVSILQDQVNETAKNSNLFGQSVFVSFDQLREKKNYKLDEVII